LTGCGRDSSLGPFNQPLAVMSYTLHSVCSRALGRLVRYCTEPPETWTCTTSTITSQV